MKTRARTRAHGLRTSVVGLIGMLALIATLPTATATAATGTSTSRAAHSTSVQRRLQVCRSAQRALRIARRTRRATAAVRRVRIACRRSSAASRPSAFQVGIAANSANGGEVDSTSALGARLIRVEFPIEASVDELRPVIAAQAAHGARVVPLAGFAGRLPTAAEARNLATWAREFGPGGAFWVGRKDGQLAMPRIEFGNETSYGYQYGDGSYTARASTYALRFKDAEEAIQSSAGNPSVGLLAQADDAGSFAPNWVKAMFDAVPDLGQRVAGWIIHPYGPDWKPRMDRLVQQTAARGAPASIPIDLTEWGVATNDGQCLTDNYKWDRCMSYQSAAATLRNTIGAMRARYGGRLRSLTLYRVTDLNTAGASNEREKYFGALKNDGSDKGAWTREVRDQLARTT